MSYEKENRIYYFGNCIRLIRKEMKIMADFNNMVTISCGNRVCMGICRGFMVC